MVDEKRSGAQALLAVRSQPERFLATVQVGITVVGTAAAAFGGASFSKHLQPLFEGIPWLAQRAEGLAFGTVVVLISFLSLVLGELVPKSLALRSGEGYALLMARPVAALSLLAKPVVWFLTASSNLVLRPFSDKTNFMETQITKEELQQMVEEAGETGALDERSSELASRALAFDKLTLSDVMIPRNRIDALPVTADLDHVRRFLLEERRSRFPVYEGSIDNIVGYASAKDIVSFAWEGRLIVLRDLLRPIKIFPETVAAIEVLRYMRREHQRIAIAVDEHGALSGLVTFEDLVEEIVGDFFSESQGDAKTIEVLADGSATVKGETPIRDINRELGLSLEEPDGAATIAGLCSHLAGGIPNWGARLAANDNVVLVVLDATARGVRRVQVIPPPQPESEPEKET